MRTSQLADALDLTPSGTTALLNRLLSASIIARGPGDEDGDQRAVLVSLTPRGREAAAIALEVLGRHKTPVCAAQPVTTRARSTTGATEVAGERAPRTGV